MNVAETKILKWISEGTKEEKVKEKYSIEVMSIVHKIQGNIFRW